MVDDDDNYLGVEGEGGSGGSGVSTYVDASEIKEV